MFVIDLMSLVRIQLAFARIGGWEQRFVARLAEALVGPPLPGDEVALRLRIASAASTLEGADLEMLARLAGGLAAGGARPETKR